MTDRYEKIRDALALLDSGDYCERAIGYSKLRRACDPDTIRELLAERDQLAAALEAAREEREALLDALRQIAEWPDGGNLYGQEKIKRFAQHTIDAAIDQARGKGVE